MVDGKVINAIENNNATSMSYLQMHPKDMNNPIYTRVRMEDNFNLKYGISPLHARIKFFEFILHIAYRLDLPEESRKKGKKKTASEKEMILKRKLTIQYKFRDKLGLIVDVPKPGFGSSNNGNTARKFFENERISSEITEIDQSLIHRFSIILTAINTSQQIDPDKFDTYAKDTLDILLSKYGWWNMSPTIHKVLVHGIDIMIYAILPLGMLSEEAQEHCNKDFKTYRGQYARRSSRIANLTDIFNRFLVASDPVITSLRAINKTISSERSLPLEIQKMLK